MQNSVDDFLSEITDKNCLLLTKDEELALKHDIAWGKYLYKMYTQQGTCPITLEAATALSLHDLECLIIFPTPEMLEDPAASVLVKTHNICIKELARREPEL